MIHDDVTQKDKLAVLRNEQQLRKASTYHALASAAADELAGGRFAQSSNRQTVIGASPISYPQLPEGNPFKCDPVGMEPPLGYKIDDMDAVGERHEIERSQASAAASVDAAVAPTSSIGGGSVGVNKSKRWRRI